MFPLPVEALARKRILFIGLVETNPRNAYFIAGEANWSGAQLTIMYDPDLPTVEPIGTSAAWSGFNPSVLPRLLFPQALDRVMPLARNVAACVVSWIPAPIPSALVIADAFFGLAANDKTGQVFLLQADPSIVDVLAQRPDPDSAT